MPKFRVSASVVGSKYIGEFEAETAEDAEQLARDSSEASISLCHQCSCECEDAECSDMQVELVEDEATSGDPNAR